MHTVTGDELLKVLRRELAGYGFDLVSSIPFDSIEPSLALAIGNAAKARGLSVGTRAMSVVVIGNRGGRFWDFLSDDERASADPIDRYTKTRVEAVFAAPGTGESVLVYPGDCGFSLLRLGGACGWGNPSWLGMNIHPDFGTWFAFRAVVVTTAQLPVSVLEMTQDTCGGCATRDCVAACPVGAPDAPGSFDLDACISWRLRTESPCASRCIAREACPAGTEDLYPQSLISHVYTRSLTNLEKWSRR